MNNIIATLFTGGIFSIVIAFLLIERSRLADQFSKKEDKLLAENSRMVKALISKNANEYVMTTAIDKVPEEPKIQQEPDTIPEENLSDEEFFESIKKQIKN